GVLKKLKDSGQIGNKVAAVNVGDDFGIELANAGRPLFKEAGFEIVYDKSYPLGTQDYAGDEGREVCQPGRFCRLVVSAGHLRSRRPGEDRKPRRQGLLLRDRLRL